MEELKACPACAGTSMRLYITCEDHLVSHQPFTIQECMQCRLLFTNPRPSADTIGEYYQSDAYISHDDTRKGVVDSVYRLVRTYALGQKEQLIRSANGGVGGVLDYGCGTGAFLTQCREQGWTITGLEPDSNARLLAAERTSCSILKDVNELVNSPQVDVITLWHVLEHVPDLKHTLAVLIDTIRSGGHLIVAVPNPSSQDATQYGANWAAYDVPRHLYHFRPDVLSALIETYGLKLTQTVPMRFDAFYIAMLSTKQRDGVINYPESVLSGLRSNRAAATTGNYSSLTYVFKKN